MTQRNYYQVDDGSFEQAHTRADVARLARRLSEVDVFEMGREAVCDEHRLFPGAFGAEAWAAYARETARHETSFARNEVDVESDGKTSRGLCQIMDGRRFDGGHYVADEDEVAEVLGPAHATVDLMAPYQNLRIMLLKAEAHGLAILRALRRSTIVRPPPDFFSFLALAHNEGLGKFDLASRGALGTLARHPERGMSWSAYKLGNGACANHGPAADRWGRDCNGGTCSDYIRRIGRYGDDCAAGAR